MKKELAPRLSTVNRTAVDWGVKKLHSHDFLRRLSLIKAIKGRKIAAKVCYRFFFARELETVESTVRVKPLSKPHRFTTIRLTRRTRSQQSNNLERNENQLTRATFRLTDIPQLLKPPNDFMNQILKAIKANNKEIHDAINVQIMSMIGRVNRRGDNHVCSHGLIVLQMILSAASRKDNNHYLRKLSFLKCCLQLVGQQRWARTNEHNFTTRTRRLKCNFRNVPDRLLWAFSIREIRFDYWIRIVASWFTRSANFAEESISWGKLDQQFLQVITAHLNRQA